MSTHIEVQRGDGRTVRQAPAGFDEFVIGDGDRLAVLPADQASTFRSSPHA